VRRRLTHKLRAINHAHTRGSLCSAGKPIRRNKIRISSSYDYTRPHAYNNPNCPRIPATGSLLAALVVARIPRAISGCKEASSRVRCVAGASPVSHARALFTLDSRRNRQHPRSRAPQGRPRRIGENGIVVVSLRLRERPRGGNRSAYGSRKRESGRC